jgi:O-antigen/teichoic acid export membrane protein
MTLVINIVSVGVSLTMSLVLLPFLGVTGIAVVRAVAMIFSFVLTFLVLRRRTSIEFDKAAIWKSWVAAAIMFVTVGLVEQVYMSRYLLPLLILVGGTVYVVALRLLKAVNEDDIELVRKLLGNRAMFVTKILQKIFF